MNDRHLVTHVSEVVEAVCGGNMDSYYEWCAVEGLDPEKILEVSARFGTIMHAWCLEDIYPKNPTQPMIACYSQWKLFLKKYNLSLEKMQTEVKIVKKDKDGTILYIGTKDIDGRLKGKASVIDLKFWKCWMWMPMKGNAKRRKDFKMEKPTGSRVTKTNLQTMLYNKEKMRYVLWITPKGFFLHPFQRKSKYYDAAIEYCRTCGKKRTF